MKKRVWGSLVVASVLFGIFGCSSMPTSEPFYTRLYVGKYDDVWLAALKALADYPLKMNNKDTGRIQTETVNGPYNDLLFTYPDPIELPDRFKYSLKLSFARLVTDDNRPLTRVRVVKELEKFQDFYTGWAAYPSDGVEEKLLLYRIEHIVRMDQQLSKETSTTSSSSAAGN